jgi:hypothetical protein
MSVFMQPLFTYEFTGTSNPVLTIANIPQSFTDLKLVMSYRRGDATNGDHYIQFNGDGNANYSYTYLQGTGTGRYTSRGTSTTAMLVGQVNGTNSTANVFTCSEYYISNYTATTPKAVLVEEHREDRSANQSNLFLVAGQYRGTSPITSILCGYGFAQYSSVTLYGILRQGV